MKKVSDLAEQRQQLRVLLIAFLFFHRLGSRKDDVCFWWERLLTLFAEGGGKADREFCTYAAARHHPLCFSKQKHTPPILICGEGGQQHRRLDIKISDWALP